jgi:Na+-translocating ferredoxin:NAD+ oxidoreductase RnfC subunit
MPTCPVGIQISTAARMSQLIRRSPSAKWLADEGQALMKKVEDCIDCGICKTHCPYELDTPALIKQHYADYKEILAGNISI